MLIKSLLFNFQTLQSYLRVPKWRRLRFFTPQLFPFYISSTVIAANLMHISALGLISLMALLATSSSRDSRPPRAHPGRRAWLSRSPGHRCPRGSSHTGPHPGYAVAMQSSCCQRSLVSRTPMSKQWTTSPRSSWVKDWHTECLMLCLAPKVYKIISSRISWKNAFRVDLWRSSWVQYGSDTLYMTIYPKNLDLHLPSR